MIRANGKCIREVCGGKIDKTVKISSVENNQWLFEGANACKDCGYLYKNGYPVTNEVGGYAVCTESGVIFSPFF